MRVIVASLLFAVTACAPVMISPQYGGPVPTTLAPQIGAEEIADLFERVVFTHEEGAKMPIQKWERPITISVITNYIPMPYPELGSFNDLARTKLNQLEELTGQDVVFLPDNDYSAALRINIVNNPDFWPAEVASYLREQWRGVWSCGGINRKNETKVSHVLVFINLAYVTGPAMLEGCMIEEVTQGLGIPGYIDSADGGIAESIFNDRIGWTDLTPVDKIIIKTLYDPRLKPGMNREQAMPIVRRVIAAKLREASP